jgi:hypothetical protein
MPAGAATFAAQNWNASARTNDPSSVVTAITLGHSILRE